MNNARYYMHPNGTVLSVPIVAYGFGMKRPTTELQVPHNASRQTGLVLCGGHWRKLDSLPAHPRRSGGRPNGSGDGSESTRRRSTVVTPQKKLDHCTFKIKSKQIKSSRDLTAPLTPAGRSNVVSYMHAWPHHVTFWIVCAKLLKIERKKKHWVSWNRFAWLRVYVPPSLALFQSSKASFLFKSVSKICLAKARTPCPAFGWK